MRILKRIMAATAAAAAVLGAGIAFATPAIAAESVPGCKVYYPADTLIDLATAAKDSDCWDSSMVSKQGRTFLGWSEEQIPDITSGAEYTAAQSKIVAQVTMVAPGKTVYAVWAAMPVLNYDVNPPAGAEAPTTPESVTVEFNTPAADSSGWKTGDKTLIPGYTFQGWTDTPNGDDAHDWTKPLTEAETTVHAKWQANKYVVRFDRNATDATGSMGDQSFEYDVEQNLTANAFKRPGWTFDGWNTKPDGKGTAYQDRQAVKNLTSEDGGTVTLYAQWKHAPVNLRFDANKGEGEHDPVKGLAYEDIQVPDDVNESFSRAGYLLAGWNTKPDGKGKTYHEGDQVRMGATDTTLYAVWTPAVVVMPPTGGEGWLIPVWTLWAVGGGMLAIIAAVAVLIVLRRKGRLPEPAAIASALAERLHVTRARHGRSGGRHA